MRVARRGETREPPSIVRRRPHSLHGGLSSSPQEGRRRYSLHSKGPRLSRQRFIDPGIWTSPQFCALPDTAKLLFIGIITTSDDYGYRRGDAARLKAEIFPLSELRVEEIEGALEEITKAQLVLTFIDDTDQKLLWLPKWHTYQKPKWRGLRRLERHPEDRWQDRPSQQVSDERDGPRRPVPSPPETGPDQPETGPDQPETGPERVEGRGVEGSVKKGSPLAPPAPPARRTTTPSKAKATARQRHAKVSDLSESPAEPRQKRIDVPVVNAIMAHWLSKVVPLGYGRCHANSGAVRAQVTAAFRSLKDTPQAGLPVEKVLPLIFERAKTLDEYWASKLPFSTVWCKGENLAKFLNGDWSKKKAGNEWTRAAAKGK